MEAVQDAVGTNTAPGALRCSCCGHGDLRLRRVLWPALVQEWELAPAEVAYIDRQQGLMCVRCGSNLRTMALAHALLTYFDYAGVFSDFVASAAAASLSVLEINEAGMLTKFLKRLPQHRLIRYPESDMTKLTFVDQSFDVVVHSDTLEHVPDPIAGLRECRRVLKPRGICAYTVPIVVDRLTRSRKGLPPSYHGTPSNPGDHPRSGDLAFVHVAGGELADLQKWRTGIEKPFHPIAREKLAPFDVPLAVFLRTAPRGFRYVRPQLIDQGAIMFEASTILFARGVDPGLQLRRAHTPISSRPISMRRISFVPAPMSSSLASR